MRRPRQLRQNLFLHFAEPRLWLKLLQLTVKVRSFEGRPHGCSSAAFRWVWHFLKVVRLPSDQRWTFRTQVMSLCRLNVRIPLTVEPAGQDISPASHAPFHGGAESRSQMREQRDLTSPQMPHGKTHCVSMQPPPQSGVLLCAEHNHLAPHSFTGYQPLISGCRVYGTTSHSHDNSPSSAAAVGREHFIIHMITAPHQRLPCVVNIF